MGRRKVEIKPIQDKASRQVSFCKRRKGLLKKAKELSVLCDVDVAAVVFSNRGRLYEFSSNNSLTKIVQRYHSHVEEISPAGASETEHSKYENFMTTADLLQAVERHLKGSEDDYDGISLTDLVHLEIQLQTALDQARSRKMDLMIESVKSLNEKETRLREENRLMKEQIASAMNNREVNELALNFTNLEPTPMICEHQQRPLLKFL